MPGGKMTPAERMRIYRQKIKQDPDRYNQYLNAERKRWKTRREEGKLKSIHDLGTKGQRLQRRLWRISKRHSDQRKKDQQHLLSPPPTPTQATSNLMSDINIITSST